MSQLNDKAVLITGSTTGIGEAIARRFASEGARVMVHGRRESEAKAVVKALHADGCDVDYCLADLADPSECERLVNTTIERFGRIDILVNNAALVPRSNLESTDPEVFDRTIAVNLRAPLMLIRAALPQFRKAGGGRVLNIGSINAYCGERNLLAYSISKGGLMTMTRNLADAHGAEGIRVNQLNVGWTLTPNEYKLKMSHGMPEDWPSHLPKSDAPGGRIFVPEEVAHFALAFVSDLAGLVNGAVVELEQYPMIGRNVNKGSD